MKLPTSLTGPGRTLTHMKDPSNAHTNVKRHLIGKCQTFAIAEYTRKLDVMMNDCFSMADVWFYVTERVCFHRYLGSVILAF